MISIPDEVSLLLSGVSDEIQTRVFALRGLVLSLMPEAKEVADQADRLIGYSLGPRLIDTICVIQLYPARVNLGLFDGAPLPDPAGLLGGRANASGTWRLNSATRRDGRRLAPGKAGLEAHARRANRGAGSASA